MRIELADAHAVLGNQYMVITTFITACEELFSKSIAVTDGTLNV